MDDLSVEQVTQSCPECGAEYPHSAGAVPWCHTCGWNLTPYLPNEQPPPEFMRQQDFFKTLTNNPDLRSPFSLSVGMGLLLATLVYIVWLAILAGGAWLVITGWPLVVPILLGLVAVAIGIGLRPRVGRLPREAVLRQQAPAAYKLVDDVTAALGTRRVAGIVFDTSFSAYAAPVGLRRHIVLRIGYPLWVALNNSEKVAVVALALAQIAGGSIADGLYVSSAVAALQQSFEILRVRDTRGYKRRRMMTMNPYMAAANMMRGVNQGGGLGDMLTNGVMWLLSLLPRLTMALLQRLLWRDDQLAAFRADRLAAGVVGPETMLGMLDKHHVREFYLTLLQRAARDRNFKGDLFEELRERVGSLTERDWDRIRRRQRLAKSWLEASLPPTAQRIALLEVLPGHQPPALPDSVFDFSTMRTETLHLRRELQATAIDEFRMASSRDNSPKGRR